MEVSENKDCCQQRVGRSILFFPSDSCPTPRRFKIVTPHSSLSLSKETIHCFLVSLQIIIKTYLLCREDFCTWSTESALVGIQQICLCGNFVSKNKTRLWCKVGPA